MSVSNRRSWDASRFFETLNYFGEVPFIGSFRWLQQLIGQKTTYTGIDMSVLKKTVAVIRASNCSSAFEQTYQSTSWQTQLKHQIQAQIADPINVVFYDLASEVDSQETLDQLFNSSIAILVLGTSTLSTLLGACGGALGESSDFIERQIFDFSESNEIAAAWGTLDDVVMGGVSQSGLALNGQGEAVFSGIVSVENSGGFASVRTKNFEPPFNFSNWEGVQLRVKGDGQRYKFILRNSNGWDSPAYIYGFDTEKEEWLSVNIPFSKMVPTFRAKSMPSAPALNPAQIYSFQLMLSKFEYDQKLNPRFEPGSFSLEIARISAYRKRLDKSLIVVADKSDAISSLQAKLTETKANYHWLPIEDADLQLLETNALPVKVAQLLNG